MSSTSEAPATRDHAARDALESIGTTSALTSGMLVLMIWFVIDQTGPSIIRFVQGCILFAVFWYMDLGGLLDRVNKAIMEDAGVSGVPALITRTKRRFGLLGAAGTGAFLGAFWLLPDVAIAGRSEFVRLAVDAPCFLALLFALDRCVKSWAIQQVPATAQTPRDI